MMKRIISLQEAASLVTGCVYYIATIRICFTFEPSVLFLKKLHESTKHCARYFDVDHQPSPDETNYQETIPLHRNEHYIAYVDIHCPTIKTVRLLIDLEKEYSWLQVKKKNGKIAKYLVTIQIISS